MAKKAKKYDLTRSDIVDELDNLIQRLSEIDTNDTSPNDVGAELSDLTTDLENLRDRVTDEA